MYPKLGWFVITVVVGGGGFALWQQGAVKESLGREVGQLRRTRSGMERLRGENQALKKDQPSATELARLRDGQGAIAQLRGEIDRLQAKVRMAEKKLDAAAVEQFVAGSKVPVGDWKNAGSATWRATLETVLWAAAGGDVDAFAGSLLLSDRTRTQATALLEKLPSPLREQLGTPEKLIAFFAIRDIPLGTAELIEQVEFPARIGQAVNAFVQMADSDGKTKDLRLRFSSQSGGWKLVVPESVTAKYSAMLKTPPAGAGP